ncbi:MAG: ribose 5-phosphate isomerase B [Chloroflexi bacterium B3_Chlor]|nr:MAG: ribose 5-phosphate isomerase B [Chloroflexi bacterium B3_Chlor]
MRIAIASDHGGSRLKSDTTRLLQELGHTHHDFGPHDFHDVDYPDYAVKVARAVADGEFDRGILICGTGQGMAMSANKVKGVRAALCHDTFSARISREHNDANVLCLGERVVGSGLAADIVKTWLEAESSDEERHHRRVGKIIALDERRALEGF